MQKKIPAVYMRGGTSKGLFFHGKDLPEDPAARDRVILAAYGSPNPVRPQKPDPNRRQIDGMGGGSYTSSLLSIISPSENPDYDIGWTFGLVSVDEPSIDYKGKSCGNIPSAVACFAIEEGMVTPVEPVTSVRILHENSGKLIIADVPVKDGAYLDDGEYAIDGVPGTSGKITLRFCDPGGEITGKLFPTGKATDVMSVPEVGEIPVTIVDAINPIVFLRARDLGLQGTEIHEIDNSEEIRGKLEAIRGRAAVMLGMAFTAEEAARTSKDMPKIAFVSKPQDYETVKGRMIRKKEIDMVARIIWKGWSDTPLHKLYAVVGAMCTAGAAKMRGTVLYDLLDDAVLEKKEFRLGHPGGIMSIGLEIEENENRISIKEATVGRTARRLMDGFVYVPESCFKGSWKLTDKSNGKNLIPGYTVS